MTAPTSRLIIVVVQSPLLFRVVGRNGEATFMRGPTIRSPPIVWNFRFTSSIFDLWSSPWGVARLLGLRGDSLRPHSEEGVGQHHHHELLTKVN